MAKLKAYVHLTDEGGHRHVFGPKDTVPGWAAKLITNPDAWDGEPPRRSDTKPAPVDTKPVDTGQVDTESVDLAAEGRYDEMTHDALQEELRRRNAAGADLKVGGKQADLIARLKEHDDAAANEGE